MKLSSSMSVLALLLLPASARAQASDPSPPRDDASGDHLRGLELMVRPGVGGSNGMSPLRLQPSPQATLGSNAGALLDGASPYGAGFVGQAFLGYRFHPLLSGGLRGGLRTASAAQLSDGTTDTARMAWDAGFYLRVYPLALSASVRRYIDPWVSVGVGYMRDTQTFKRPATTADGRSVIADGTLDHHAVNVPIAVGIDYRVLPFLSVGPSFEYAIASPVAGCAKQSAAGFQSATYCSNEDPGKSFLSAEGYGVWSLGLDVKLTVF